MTCPSQMPRHRQGLKVPFAALLATALACLVPLLAAVSWAKDARAPVSGQEMFIFSKDSQVVDRVITVLPPDAHGDDSTMIIRREPGTDDQIIHVVPPREEKQEPDIILGPLFITPKITWPDQRKPHKDNRR